MVMNRQIRDELMRNVRRLGHQKTSRVQFGDGVPDNKIGYDGEFRLHMTNLGLKLYAKYQGKWYTFSPDETSNVETYSTNSTGGLDAEGYVTFPGGFMMQWGKETVTGNTKSITFPVEFPKNCIGAFLTIEDGGSGGEAESAGIVTSSSITTTGFTANTDSNWDSIYWLAIGN